jgi:hypothetical protein
MSSLPPEARTARARIAARARWHRDKVDADTAPTPEMKRLERARVDRIIDNLVKTAGTLTAEQAETLRALLPPPGAA